MSRRACAKRRVLWQFAQGLPVLWRTYRSRSSSAAERLAQLGHLGAQLGQLTLQAVDALALVLAGGHAGAVQRRDRRDRRRRDGRRGGHRDRPVAAVPQQLDVALLLL